MLGIALTLLLAARVMATRPFFGPDQALPPPNVACVDSKPDLTGSGRAATTAGDCCPLAYFAPAAALALGKDANSALWLAGSVINPSGLELAASQAQGERAIPRSW